MIGSGSPNNKVFFKEEIDQKILDDFKEQRAEEARQSGKPNKAIEKIVEGQVDKFLRENLIAHITMISTKDLTWLKLNDNGEVTIEEAIKQTEESFEL